MINLRMMPFFFLSFVMLSGPVMASQEGTSGFVLPQYSQKLSLDFKSADLKDVLKALSKQIGANFILNKDVAPDIKITVYLENVPVEESLNQVLLANDLIYEYNESMNLFIVKTKPVALETTITRIFALRYASVDSSKMKTTVAAGSGAAAPAASGGGSLTAAISSVLTKNGKVVDDTRTNSLVITDVETNFPAIERMIARLDIPVRQVVIEMEMLDVSTSVLDKLGSNINLNAHINNETKGSVFPWRTNRVTELNLTQTNTFSSGTLNFANSMLVLDFLKQQSSTRTLARPRIVTPDNETATIQITTNEVIGGKKTDATSTSAATVALERYETGVSLTVTPQVNALTNEILLSIAPKVIDAGTIQTIMIDGTSTEYKNPEERSVNITVRVENGKTAVIGGLLRYQDNSVNSSVPILSKIPLIGFFFKHKVVNKADRELVVFLTPRVLDPNQPISVDPNNKFARPKSLREQLAPDREQTAPDIRSGLIDREMDKLNGF